MRREATLVPQLSGGPYGPGAQVTGVLVAREEQRTRRLNAYRRYVDRSPSFSGAETYDAAEPLPEGPVDARQEIPFELRLPTDAYQGASFGFNWRVLAIEKRRFFQSDAGRIAYLEAMP